MQFIKRLIEDVGDILKTILFWLETFVIMVSGLWVVVFIEQTGAIYSASSFAYLIVFYILLKVIVFFGYKAFKVDKGKECRCHAS